MIRSTDLADFDRLCVRYLEANTPWYLLRTFRASPGPEQLAQRFTANELVQFIDRLCSDKNRDASNTVLAYACTVALTYRSLPEVNLALATGPAHRPSWFTKLMAFYRAKATGDSKPKEFAVRTTPKLIVGYAPKSSNTTVTDVKPNYSAKILVPDVLAAPTKTSK